MSLPNACKSLLKKLKEQKIGNIEAYEKRLIDNSSEPDTLKDFFQEGFAALTLSENNFEVTFSERPDLKVKYEDCAFNAEVKHFRLKKQDVIDDKRMTDEEDFVEYGNTKPSEGDEAWCQVYNVLKKKDEILPSDNPGIIILISSSIHCVEDSEVKFAVNKIDEEIYKKKRNISPLNGVLYIGKWYNLKQPERYILF